MTFDNFVTIWFSSVTVHKTDKRDLVSEGLVIAGLGDLQRPANQLSVSQSSALAVTGIIWTKYSLAITPKNWSLFSVNLFVAITSLYQISRAINYKRQQGGLAKATTTEGK
ncbi:mitochondrial pyruvate carrier 2 isoform X2 [Nomia melanderi]|uniref:mitochondrial pyruvate carrier 2 isoform X2 n=1 Tax=Nomia melanderi TaxID=2448451 RepID=UPI001304281B|nr:mitochondrial pyruvate carrier 2-like isoform X2 [Nomia melanderi]